MNRQIVAINRRIGAILVATLIVSGQVPALDAKAKRAESDIRAADQEWARVFAAKDLEKSVGACTESGSVLAPNAARATGRVAIRQAFAGFFSLPELSISWKPIEIRVAHSGDMGYSTGGYQMSFKGSGGTTVSDHGKYATIWEKQRDGGWKVVLDIFNTDLPVAGAAK